MVQDVRVGEKGESTEKQFIILLNGNDVIEECRDDG